MSNPHAGVLLDQVRQMLGRGEAQKALDVIGRAKSSSQEIDNARAVCLMRLGRPEAAVTIYQGMLLRGGVTVDPAAPVKHVVNFATALLLAGNTAGGLAVLDGLGRTAHPAAVRLREAVDRWRESIGFGRRFLFAAYGAAPARRVEPDSPPGEV